MSKNVYLTLGDKGGIGKTFTAKVLRDWFKILNRTASCFDLDTENGSFYGYAKDSIKLCDFSDKLGWLDAVYNSTASQIVVDVPGGKVAELAATLDAGIPALQKAVKDAGRELIAVQPIGCTTARWRRNMFSNRSEAVAKSLSSKTAFLENRKIS